MDLRIAAATIFALCVAWRACAQDEPAPIAAGNGEAPEEIVVTGARNLFQLRQQMMDAEKQAYDIFNSLNDEKRFDISCSRQQPTGRFLTNQLCQPAFIIEASAVHGQAYLQNLRDFLQPPGGIAIPDMPVPTGTTRDAAIASQQAAYRRNMREVAEQHPEFLEALIRYSEIKAQYEGTPSSATP
jgi:hypothetical protein